MLQSFGGTTKPHYSTCIFGLGRSGIHMSLMYPLASASNAFADMAAMAESALAPAIRELHITVEHDVAIVGGELQATVPLCRVHGFLVSLSSMQRLSIRG